MMRTPIALLFALLAMGCSLEPVAGVGQAAAPRDAALQAIVEQAAAGLIVPLYTDFETSTNALPAASQSFCGARDATNLAALRVAWRAAMSDWQEVQIALFGPASELARALRVQIFPEPTVGVAAAVESKLRGPGTIDEVEVAASQVQVQGLPALEYLIFGDDSAVLASFGDDPDGDRRCELLVAVAANLATVGTELASEWRDEWGPAFVTAAEGNAQFDERGEVISELVSATLQLLELIADRKIDDARGAALGLSDPEELESWRSRTSLQNIHANLVTIRLLYRGGDGFGIDDFLSEDIRTESVDEEVEAAFDAAITAVGRITVPLFEALESADERPYVDAIWVEVGALRTVFGDEVVPALNAQVLFNSNDGD